MNLALKQSKAVSKHEIEIVSSLSTPDSLRATTQEIILADGENKNLFPRPPNPVKVFHLHDPENI